MSPSLPSSASPGDGGIRRRLIVIAIVVALFVLAVVLIAWFIGGTPTEPFDYDL